jgi:hypothetical protein
MSVLKNKRTLSKLEFFNNAIIMRKEITKLLLQDFGIKDKIRKIKDDNKELTIIEEYPEWLIRFFRQSIISTLRNLMMNITAGNTIYPSTPEELTERRKYQTMSIINCEQLLCDFNYIAEVFPVELKKYMPFIEKILFEIKLLKGWRKSSNELLRKIQANKGVKSRNNK